MGDRVYVHFHLPTDYKPPESVYKILIEQSAPQMRNLRFEKPSALRADSPLIIKGFHNRTDATWNIMLEDALAFHGKLSQQQSEVFG